MEGDAAGELGELLLEGFARGLREQLPAGAAGDPSQDEQMAERIEIGVVSRGVGEVGADGPVDAGGPVVPGRHGLLNFHEPFGEGQGGVDGEAGLGDEASNPSTLQVE